MITDTGLGSINVVLTLNISLIFVLMLILKTLAPLNNNKTPDMCVKLAPGVLEVQINYDHVEPVLPL